ncbi:MAG: hypothetical protein PHF60_04620 [Candidatus ainarchaeum sp.]|nr:hypothetical protein [Candidatus ainarchaeum sp.]
MKTLSHRTGHIAAKREMAAAQTRRESAIAPLVEHIHRECKPKQRIFLSYRSPWRRYYYAKSSRMKGGIAARAIMGSGWNWYMVKGKTNMVFKRQEHHGLSPIAKERNEQQNARSVNIDIGKAKAIHTNRTGTKIGANSTDSSRIGIRTDNRTEIRTGNSEIRIGNNTNPAANMSGRSEAPITGKHGSIGSPVTILGNVASNASGVSRNVQTGSAGFIGMGKEAAPSQVGSRSERIGSVFASSGIVVKLPTIHAAITAIRTIPSIPGMVLGFMSQSRRTNITAQVQVVKAPQNTITAITQTTRHARAEPTSASIKTETVRTSSASIAIRAPEFRPMRIRKGPGYIGSWQKKTAQLKTTQGAANPE